MRARTRVNVGVRVGVWGTDNVIGDGGASGTVSGWVSGRGDR